jgi:AcrR family transcriptional regulator
VVLPAGAPPRPVLGRTRAVLVAGAGRAFADQGLRGCTMQAIAAAAGVSKATLYNYFRTKEEVASALLSTELDRLTAVAASLPAAEALAALADELGEHPVVRRLAKSEPDVLADLVGVTEESWADLTARLAAVLGTDEDGAGIAARWLLGVLLRPARSSARHRAAARLAAALSLGDARAG